MGETDELSIGVVTLIALIGLTLTLIGLGFLELLNRSVSKFWPLYIPHTPARIALVALGSTLIVLVALEAKSASNLSARDEVYKDLGEIDEVLMLELGVSEGNEASDSYFPIAQFEELRVTLSNFGKVEGLAPLIVERASVVNARTGKNAGSIVIRGIESDYTRALPSQECVKSFLASHTEWPFGQILSTSGNSVIVDNLRGNEVFINQAAARQLEANAGHELQTFLGNAPLELQVKDVVLNGGLGGDEATILIPLAKAQEVFDKEERINTIFVSNRGDSKSGLEMSDEVAEYLRVVLADRWQGLNVHEVKKDALADAGRRTDGLASALAVIRLFSVAGGVMLVVVSSAVLVAARLRETGTVYPIANDGLQVDRSSGKRGLAGYALSALAGGLLGILIGLSLVSIMFVLLPFDNILEIASSHTWRNLIIAGCSGMALAIVTTFLPSRRVVRLLRIDNLLKELSRKS